MKRVNNKLLFRFLIISFFAFRKSNERRKSKITVNLECLVVRISFKIYKMGG